MEFLPQAGQIAHDALVKHLEPYVHLHLGKTPGLWTHKIRPINFTLVVDDFGVKYLVKQYALHLKLALKDKYKVTTDWEGKLYIGIQLKWDYEKGKVQHSMPGYVRAAQHYFQHKKHKIPHDSPHPWKQSIHEKNRCYQRKHQLKN